MRFPRDCREGEGNPNHKLSEPEVMAIRNSLEPVRLVAKWFGIAFSTVSEIRTTSAVAIKVSKALGSRVTVLNEVGYPPVGTLYFNEQHCRKVARLSEALRRIDRYLESHRAD